MKIKVNSVKEEGFDCIYTYEPQKLDIDSEETKLLKPFDASYHIKREGQNLFVDVEIKLFLSNTCSRCLEDFESLLDRKYSFYYKAKDPDVVNTAEDLRKEIMLEYPLKPLCKPDCLGLCPECGENLNKGKCNCKIS
ncbi:MAG: DUF177 domain-containing protein [Candidatus Omnitrophica bacterium]|nr:DUF177 domain-containing protein [Candidatus Omnitrophota bacterium]